VQDASRDVCKRKLEEQCAKCPRRSVLDEDLRAEYKMPQEEHA
jgi:hypothetical protein